MNRFDNQETFTFAMLLAKKVALDLDAEDYSALPVLSDLLMEFPTEMVAIAVRTHIGIERCVKHSLDEDGPFLKVLVHLNKAEMELGEYVEDEDPNED